MKPTPCTITTRVAGPCDLCGGHVDVAHLLEQDNRIALFCAQCCPACNRGMPRAGPGTR